jgi:hypothetical protein
MSREGVHPDARIARRDRLLKNLNERDVAHSVTSSRNISAERTAVIFGHK